MSKKDKKEGKNLMNNLDGIKLNADVLASLGKTVATINSAQKNILSGFSKDLFDSIQMSSQVGKMLSEAIGQQMMEFDREVIVNITEGISSSVIELNKLLSEMVGPIIELEKSLKSSIPDTLFADEILKIPDLKKVPEYSGGVSRAVDAYIDALEKKVEELGIENADLKKKLKDLKERGRPKFVV